MKRTLVRLILFALFALLFLYVIKLQDWLLWAFIATYIVEDWILQKLGPGGGNAR